MSYEIVMNNPSTTLNGAITSSATSITVTSSSGFPLAGNFKVRIDNEILSVTAVSGTTWTVVRAYEPYAGSQIAASHSNGASVTLVLSAEGLNQFTAVQIGGETITGLDTPSGLAISNVGTASTKTYSYKVVARSNTGGTAASSVITTTTGATTLNSSNYNQITWNAVPRAVSYDIYRTATNGTPSTTGKIANVLSSSSTPTTYNDQGAAGDSASAPTTDTSFFSGVNNTAPTCAWDVTGGGQYSTGLNVGFSGTVNSSRIALGDSNYYLDFSVAGAGPGINFDSGDYFYYDRSGNTWNWLIASTTHLQLSASGLNLADGLRVGFSGAPANASRIEFGDSASFLDFGNVASSQVTWQWNTNYKLAFSRINSELIITMNGVNSFDMTSDGNATMNSGLTLDNGQSGFSTRGIELWSGNGTSTKQQHFYINSANTPARWRVVGHVSAGTDTEWATIKDSTGWAAASSPGVKSNIQTVSLNDANRMVRALINQVPYSFVRNDDIEQKTEYGVLSTDALTMPEILGDLQLQTVSPVRWLGALTVIVQRLAIQVARLTNTPIVWEAGLNLKANAGARGSMQVQFNPGMAFSSQSAYKLHMPGSLKLDAQNNFSVDANVTLELGSILQMLADLESVDE